MSLIEIYGKLQLEKKALWFRIQQIEKEQQEIEVKLNEDKKNNRPEGGGEPPAGGGELAPELPE